MGRWVCIFDSCEYVEEDDEDIRYSDEMVNGRKLIKAATLSRLVEVLTQVREPLSVLVLEFGFCYFCYFCDFPSQYFFVFSFKIFEWNTHMIYKCLCVYVYVYVYVCLCLCLCLCLCGDLSISCSNNPSGVVNAR